ncbi:MAG: molybdopterin-dependent oxidoreductase [Candidatus Scalinduaceae bacterium]
MINLKIDDKDVSVSKGTNIFMAARNNGIYIPGLCYHPKLTQYGGCRLCMVEVTERGRTRHRFSCAQPVSEGMEVKTKTPKTKKYTKSVMEYLLAHHPLDCPTCDKSGECGLQDVTHDLKLSTGRFKTVRMDEPMRRDNPLLELNVNRCILCGRCVKVCKEIEGVGAIDYQNRGFKTVIGTAFNKPLDCSFCGGCVSVCPTGSWQDRTLKFRARPWELKTTSTICTYCAVGCTVVLNSKNDKVMRITSDDALGINEGNLCVKGKFGHEFINSSRRVKTPLIRKIGILCPTSWDEALDYVSKKFSEIINKHGGKALGGIGSEKCSNEDNYVFQKFCRSVLGTNNIDNMANLKSPSLNRLIQYSIKNGIATTSLEEIENADTLFFVGADVTEAHPVIGNMARKAIRLNKSKLIIANVRNVEFNSIAKKDVRLNYAIGSQTALINSLIKVIIDEKLIDIKKVESSTENFKELRSMLKTFAIKKASKLTNVPEDSIKRASVLLTEHGNCYIICGKDIEEDTHGEDTIKALMNLSVLLNAVYSLKPGGGRVSLLFSRTNNNSQGVNDMGVVPDFLPGYLDINDPTNRKKVEESWGMKLSDDVYKKDSKDVFDLALSNKVKAFYVMGENPIVSYPNGKKAKEAFQKADFVVVQDNFLTETAQIADVVLPTSTYAEKEGTFTNMGMTVQRLNKAIQQMGDSKPDWQIICDLAKKMGDSYSYISPKEIMSEVGNSVSIYEGIENNNLEKEGFRWISSIYNKCEPVKYKFEIFKSEPLIMKESKKYPFILLTGHSLNHQGTFSRNSSSLVSVASECFVEINKKNAQKANIKDGEMVIIESAQDKIKLKAKTTSRVPEGAVFVSEDYEWAPINNLRNNGYTNVKISKAY